jgi:Mn2+/Fe2+ NRAMP family transporter
LLQVIVLPLFLANTINLGADLSGMADAAKLLFGGPAFIYVIGFGLICILGIVFVRYSRYEWCSNGSH